MGLHPGPCVHWLLTRLLVSPDTILCAQVIRNYCCFKIWNGLVSSWEFPPHVYFSQWRSKNYMFWRRRSRHESKPRLTKKGRCWWEKKGERNFSESEQFLTNGISKSKSSFKGIFFLCFAFILWDCLTPLAAASTRGALPHITFLCSC